MKQLSAFAAAIALLLTPIASALPIFTTFEAAGADPAAILPLLQALGPVPDSPRPKLLLVAEGDVPSLQEVVAEAAAALTAAERQVITLQQHHAAALPATIGAYLPHWFNHADLKTNPEVVERIQAWLACRWGPRDTASVTRGST